MSEMGRKGGKAAKGKGVKARMAALTPEQRKELARKAAKHGGPKQRKSIDTSDGWPRLKCVFKLPLIAFLLLRDSLFV